jgi:ADP-ribose pyrophosphatase YjhB (NUDIX family)
MAYMGVEAGQKIHGPSIGETKANFQECPMTLRVYPQAPVCAVGAIVFRGSEVLLVQRGKPPAQGKWSIPGGAVRLGETLESAIVREIREEAGMDVKPLGVGKVIDRIYKDSQGKIAYHYVIVDYVCEASAEQPTPGSDANDAGFFEIQGLDGMDLTEGTAEVIREVQRRWKTIDQT